MFAVLAGFSIRAIAPQLDDNAFEDPDPNLVVFCSPDFCPNRPVSKLVGMATFSSEIFVAPFQDGHTK